MAVLNKLDIGIQNASATVETGWPAGQANIRQNPTDGFIDFEEGTDGAVISSTIPGVKFTTTMGINWRYGDIRTGNYNVYPYGSQSYETNGNFFAWLGVTGNTGRIDFTEGTATYLSVLVSTYSGLTLDAYDAANNFLATSGWANTNINTRTFTRLTVEAPGMAYVLVHDTGNFWLIDDLCTDAPGVPAPIEDQAKETISNYIQSADRDGDGNFDFGWNSGYDISFESETLHIVLNIQLVGDDPGDVLRQQWKDGIEGIWSNQYDLTIFDGFYTYPIEVEVNWVNAGAHHVVTAHSGNGRDNMVNWYTESDWGPNYQDEIKAHEAGHMLGLYDEYLDDGVIDEKDGAIDPDTLFTTTNSIMSDLGPPRSENYEQILEWLGTKSGRDISFANSPLPPYKQDDPIPDFSDPFNMTPPVANFTYTPDEPTDIENVYFTDTSTDEDGTVADWSWDFGDGNTSALQNPTHQYADEGTYHVMLTVTDNNGTSDSILKDVVVSNVAPTSYADGPYNGTTDYAIQFNSLGSYDPDGVIVSYQWDFGDGNNGSGVQPTHTYDKYGVYNVTLLVTDDDGLADTDGTLAIINRGNPPIIHLLYPTNGEVLKGTVTVKWYAHDLIDGDNLPIYI